MNRNNQIAQFKTSERWFKTDVIFAQPDLKVDAENGIIRDVSVCTAGEAKGHGLMLEQSFIDDVARLGNDWKQGVKCRFGHPNMSNESLGTYLGRFTNFRVEGIKAIADLQLDEVAKKAPGGDIYTYVLEMATKNPDMFGTSITFQYKYTYFYDKDGQKVKGENPDDGPTFASIEKLTGTVVVDEPAANPGGLFSSNQFNADKFAVRITGFLDENPDIWSFVEKHPEKFKPFFDKYAAYKQKQTVSMSKKETPKPKKLGFFARMKAAFAEFATAEATTTDGNKIRIVMAGEEPAVDDEIFVVADDGSESVAPDGDHTVDGGDMDGYIFSVADGKITAIVTPDAVDEASNPPVDAQQSAKPTAAEQKLQAENDKLKKEFAALQAEFAAFKKKPLVNHTEVVPGEDGTPGDTDPDAQFRNQPWNKNKKRLGQKA